MTEPLLLTPKQAAETLGVSERKLWAMTFEADNNPLPYVRCGRLVRYPLDALRAWISASMVSAKQS